MSAADEAVVRRFYDEMNNGRKLELAPELFTADPRTVEGGQVRHEFRTARRVTKGHGRREIRQLTVDF